MKDTWIWDEREMRVVRLSFIRNFTLEPYENSINVIGWFNDKESFKLKVCKSFEEAQEFLKKLIEEKT